MDPGTEHLLRVTNSVGTAEFSVQFDGGRRCQCREVRNESNNSMKTRRRIEYHDLVGLLSAEKHAVEYACLYHDML